MRTKKGRNGLLICLVFLYLFPILRLESVANEQENPQDYEVTVTLKLIQVYVTDKSGIPVTDLGADDFEIYDKGQLKTISDFERHLPRIPSFEIEGSKVPVGTSAPKLNRKFFLFFDFAFNTLNGIKDSKRAALHFIDSQILPTDEIGVLSYSANKGLAIHENLTSDHHLVREVVEGIGIKDFLGRAENVEIRYWGKVQEVAAIQAAEKSAVTQSNISGGRHFQSLEKQLELASLESERNLFIQNISNYTKGMEDLGQALSHVQGHKHLVFFSAGIPSSVLGGIMAPPLNKGLAQGTYGETYLRNRYEIMIKSLAASNSSVYTIFSRGQDQNFSMDMDTNLAVKQMPWSDIRNDRQLLGRQSLQQLSEETGGRYYGNIKNYQEIMEEIQNVTASYYVLGFSIDERWDGKYHEIDVKVKREGCQVQSQVGYFNPKPFSEYSALEKKLHFVELAIEETSQFQTPHSFNLTVVPFRKNQNSGLITISKIPKQEIEKISGTTIEIANLFFDDKGNVFDLQRFETDFLKFPKKDIYYYSLTFLPVGFYTYRVVFRNLHTGEAAVASASVEIPEASASDLQIFPPLLTSESRDVFYLKGKSMEEKDGRSKPLGLVNIYPFDLSQYAPVVEVLPSKTEKLFIVLPCRLPGNPQGKLRFHIRLIENGSGREILTTFSVLDNFEEGDIRILHIELQIGRLKAGDYRLDFMIGETESQRESTVSTAFAVK